MKEKSFVKKIEKVWGALFLVVFSALAFAGNAANDPLAGFNKVSNTGFTGMIQTLGGYLLTFIDDMKGILLIAVILGFVWSIFGQIRGQQIDITEILKNVLIYGIAGSAIWFGPTLLRSLFGQLNQNQGTTQGASINEQLLIEESLPENMIIENGTYYIIQ